MQLSIFMGWLERILRKAMFFKGEKKGWEDTYLIIEDVGQCSCFPENFRLEEDVLKAGLYEEFKGKVSSELLKKDLLEYLRQCGRYVEWELQKSKYKLKEIGKGKAYKRGC